MYVAGLSLSSLKSVKDQAKLRAEAEKQKLEDRAREEANRVIRDTAPQPPVATAVPQTVSVSISPAAQAIWTAPNVTIDTKTTPTPQPSQGVTPQQIAGAYNSYARWLLRLMAQVPVSQIDCSTILESMPASGRNANGTLSALGEAVLKEIIGFEQTSRAEGSVARAEYTQAILVCAKSGSIYSDSGRTDSGRTSTDYSQFSTLTTTSQSNWWLLPALLLVGGGAVLYLRGKK